MHSLNIQMFIELEKITKPTAAVLAIARLSCIFFESLRMRDLIKLEQVKTMQSWQQIQLYVREHLMCQVPEIRTLLRQKIKILSQYSTCPID